MYIHQTMMVKKLITKYREYSFRHTKHEKWPVLRRIILASHPVYVFDVLQMCKQVRSEWRTEPDSWIYAIRHVDGALPKVIYDEIHDNQWS